MNLSTKNEVIFEIGNILNRLSTLPRERPNYFKNSSRGGTKIRLNLDIMEQGFYDAEFDSQLLLTSEALASFLIPLYTFPEKAGTLRCLTQEQFDLEINRILNWVEKDGFSGKPYIELHEIHPQHKEYELVDTAAFVLTVMMYTLRLTQKGLFSTRIDLERIEGVASRAVEFLLNAHNGMGWGWTTTPNGNSPEHMSHLYFTYSAMISLRDIDFERVSLARYRDKYEDIRKKTRVWIENRYLKQLLDPEDTGIIVIDRTQNLIGNAYALGTLFQCDYPEKEIINRIVDIWLSCYQNDLRSKQFHRVINYKFFGDFINKSGVVEEFEDTTILPAYLAVCLEGVSRHFYPLDKIRPMIDELVQCVIDQRLNGGIFDNLYGGGGTKWGRQIEHNYEMCYTERVVEFLCSLGTILDDAIPNPPPVVDAQFSEDGGLLIRISPAAITSSSTQVVHGILKRPFFDINDAEMIIQGIDFKNIDREHIYRLCLLYNVALEHLEGKKASTSLNVTVQRIWEDIRQRLGIEQQRDIFRRLIKYIGSDEAIQMIRELQETNFPPKPKQRKDK